ncbi:hypothetical protein BpHYR1_021973 [Brachionus plicatilis]|uniref:Uncharacterized protein n=1 Tax=Brachionus plicatilis TaxID=10195 RepID=A0A3M7PF37_BRAPC|nr:hypothetical protein BpHYR1_021973 [Brachionus plicatilis]
MENETQSHESVLMNSTDETLDDKRGTNIEFEFHSSYENENYDEFLIRIAEQPRPSKKARASNETDDANVNCKKCNAPLKKRPRDNYNLLVLGTDKVSFHSRPSKLPT